MGINNLCITQAIDNFKGQSNKSSNQYWSTKKCFQSVCLSTIQYILTNVVYITMIKDNHLNIPQFVYLYECKQVKPRFTTSSRVIIFLKKTLFTIVSNSFQKNRNNAQYALSHQKCLLLYVWALSVSPSPYLVGLLWYALSCFRMCLYQAFFAMRKKIKTQGKNESSG